MNSIRHFFRAFYAKTAGTPVKNMLLFLAVMGIVWAIQCAVCQTMVPTDTKEAISWGAQWEWGYYKHPPLAAHIAYAWHKLFCGYDIGLYLLAQLCIICGVFFSYKFAAEFFDERRSVMAALALYFLYYYNPSPMNFNPNFVEMALLPLLSFLFIRCLRAPLIPRWLVFGFFAGLAVLGKYSAGFLLSAFFIMMLIRKEYRKQIFSPGPYLAFLVFVLVLLPHIFWLVRHDFSCLTYLDESVNRDSHSWTFLFNILGMALYPFAMAFAAFFLSSMPRHLWKREITVTQEPLQWGLILCLIPVLFFLVIGIRGGNIIATWFFSLTSWAPVAVMAAWPWHISRRTFRKFFLLLLFFTFCMLTGTALDAACKARARLHLKPEILQEHVQAFLKPYHAEKIAYVIGEGEIAYALEMYFPWHPVSAEMEDPHSMNSILPELQKEGGLLITMHKTDCENFIRDFCRPEAGIRFSILMVPYRALWSKPQKRIYFAAYLPPGCLKKTTIGKQKQENPEGLLK